MKEPTFVKHYFAASKTISRWWHPESQDPRKNPFLPYSEFYVKEVDDVIKAAEAKGRKTLDAGTGDGRLLERLLELKPSDICGVDISRDMLAAAKTRVSHSEKAHFVLADIENLPFRESIFDSVLCIQTLVHVPRPRIGLSELSRVSTPGGRVIVDITNRNASAVIQYFRDRASFISFLNAMIRFIALYLPYGPLKGMGGPWRQYSPKDVQELLTKHDLQLLQKVSYGTKAVFTMMIFTNRKL